MKAATLEMHMVPCLCMLIYELLLQSTVSRRHDSVSRELLIFFLSLLLQYVSLHLHRVPWFLQEMASTENVVAI